MLENNQPKMSNKLKIFYGAIILICIIAIIIAIVVQIRGDHEKEQKPLQTVEEESASSYKKEFNELFKNKVNYLKNNSYKITKIEQQEEIVYTDYQKKETKINDYELDVNIPKINIKNQEVENFNLQIQDTFEKKAKSVLNTKDSNIIYTVNYSAYVTNNILSLVVRSTLKEGNNPQRDIVQTFNYDLTNQKTYTIEEILNMKGITKQQANQKIKDEIQKVQERVKELEQLGYTIYSRKPESDIYNINNVTEYFIGQDDALYIIFAYGNENNTSEMDIVIM